MIWEHAFMTFQIVYDQRLILAKHVCVYEHPGVIKARLIIGSV